MRIGNIVQLETTTTTVDHQLPTFWNKHARAPNRIIIVSFHRFYYYYVPASLPHNLILSFFFFLSYSYNIRFISVDLRL